MTGRDSSFKIILFPPCVSSAVCPGSQQSRATANNYTMTLPGNLALLPLCSLLCLFSHVVKTKAPLETKNQLNPSHRSRPSASCLFLAFFFFYRRSYLGIKEKAVLLHPLKHGKTKGKALKAKVTAEEQAAIHLQSNPLGLFPVLFLLIFPPDQRAVSTVCIIHEANRADSVLWLGELMGALADFDVYML